MATCTLVSCPQQRSRLTGSLGSSMTLRVTRRRKSTTSKWMQMDPRDVLIPSVHVNLAADGSSDNTGWFSIAGKAKLVLLAALSLHQLTPSGLSRTAPSLRNCIRLISRHGLLTWETVSARVNHPTPVSPSSRSKLTRSDTSTRRRLPSEPLLTLLRAPSTVPWPRLDLFEPSLARRLPLLGLRVT